MCNLTTSDKEKLGNTAIYIASHTTDLSKTKLLKLLYLVEETSVRKFKTPFLGIPYEVWAKGPVNRDVYYDLKCDLSLLGDYLTRTSINDKMYYTPKKEFCDDEFSDNDINVLQEVIEKYGHLSAASLIDVLHQKGSLWDYLVKKNNLKDLFTYQTYSDIQMDLSKFLTDTDKSFYNDQMEFLQISRTYNK